MNIKKLFFVLFIATIMILNFVPAYALEQNSAKMLLQKLDNYVVDITVVNDKTVHVIQGFDIVSQHKDSIIPGRAKLVLYNGMNPRNAVANIGGSRKDISSQDIIEEDGNKVIYYEIWRPIAPGESLPIQIEFDTDLTAKGFLFKQMNLNFGEPELEINKMFFILNLPEKYGVTYSEPALTSSDGQKYIIEFDNVNHEESVVVEYSPLPLPVLPFHGYWLWLTLVIISLGLFAYRILKK